MSEFENNVVNLEASQSKLRDSFLGWQCRLRQRAVRTEGGRPTSGMCPGMIIDGEHDGSQITIVISKLDSYPHTAQFRQLVRSTQDPRERYTKGLEVLAAAYYQRAPEFSDLLTALFNSNSQSARRALAVGKCMLNFEQFSQRFMLPCAVRKLHPSDPHYQATYWHNSLFNTAIPGDCVILGFKPDWQRASADPSHLPGPQTP